MKNFKNILIVRTDRIGDVVLTTPAIKALRQRYPQARISILVNPLTYDLVDGNPDIDEVIVDDRKNAHKGALGFWKLVGELRQRKFDLAIIFHTKKRTNLLCWLAGIPHRTGYRNEKLGFLLNHPLKDRRHFGEKHEAEYCLDVVRHLTAASNPALKELELFVPIKEESQRWLKQFLFENNISESDKVIVIHPGASDPARYWPHDRFAEIINCLVDRYQAKIILVGSVAIRTTIREIMVLVKGSVASRGGVVFDMSGLTTVSQLVSLLKRSDLLISNDSGPVHIAAAVKTPVISIFTRNQPGINPERWAPLNKKSISIAVARDNAISFKKAGSLDPQYSQLIPTQEVLEAVDVIFKLC